MSDCIFCKIINKEITNNTVYEDEAVLAFLDIFPHAKGHTVVIPKKHVETIENLSNEDVASLFFGVKKTLEKIKSVLKPDGFNVGWNHSDEGGQVVKHLHIHIMPRYKKDGGGSMHSVVNNPGDVSVAELSKLFV